MFNIFDKGNFDNQINTMLKERWPRCCSRSRLWTPRIPPCPVPRRTTIWESCPTKPSERLPLPANDTGTRSSTRTCPNRCCTTSRGIWFSPPGFPWWGGRGRRWDREVRCPWRRRRTRCKASRRSWPARRHPKHSGRRRRDSTTDRRSSIAWTPRKPSSTPDRSLKIRTNSYYSYLSLCVIVDILLFLETYVQLFSNNKSARLNI